MNSTLRNKRPILNANVKSETQEQAKQPELQVNPEYAKLLPKLSKQEYEALKESIKNEGQYFPIIVNEEKEILEGHHRYRACQELGITPRLEVWRCFDDKLEEKKFVIKANLVRRQLNEFQRIELSLPLYEIEKELAKQRQIELGKTHGKDPLGSFEHKGKARDVVAKKVGVSPITFQRALTIIEKAPEKLKQKVREGQMSICYAYKMVKREEESREFPQLPEGQFNVIYADPPWRYDLPFAGSPDMHYPTLETEKISRLEIPSAEGSVLFLWATNPFLKDALRVMEAWGFEYKTNMVWVKDKTGTGYWVRGQHELLLIGIKGEKHPPLEQDRVSSVINTPRTNHSKKPEAVYELIEKMFPNAKFLELFARNHRDGWTSWGLSNES